MYVKLFVGITTLLRQIVIVKADHHLARLQVISTFLRSHVSQLTSQHQRNRQLQDVRTLITFFFGWNIKSILQILDKNIIKWGILRKIKYFRKFLKYYLVSAFSTQLHAPLYLWFSLIWVTNRVCWRTLSSKNSRVSGYCTCFTVIRRIF